MIESERVLSFIKDIALQEGISQWGITDSSPLEQAFERVSLYQNKIPSLNSSSRESAFWSPRAYAPDCQSILVAMNPYPVIQTPLPEEGFWGNIAPYTQHNFYKDVDKKLKNVAKHIKKNFNIPHCGVLSNGPIAAKPLLERTGLAQYGKNGIMHCQDWGSRFVIGLLLLPISLPISKNKPLKDVCKTCNICIKSCPAQALTKPYFVNRSKCLQSLGTSEEIFAPETVKAWGKKFYGCDICQKVCPANKKEQWPPFKNHLLRPAGERVNLIEILESTETQYFERFIGNQLGAGWISFQAMQRNALVALWNHKTEEAQKLTCYYAQKTNFQLLKRQWDVLKGL